MNGAATVIFDFDGTLANTVDLVFRLYNEHVEQFGYKPIKKSEIPELRRMGYKKAMKIKGIRYTSVPKIIRTIVKEMREHMDEVEPYDGIVSVLEQLQENGYSIGVLTSNQASLVKDFLKRHKFPAFDFVVSERTLFGKDKALRRILKRHGLDKDQVIYVGDEPRDVAASHKAGIQVIGVTWGVGGTEGFEDTQPDYQVDSPKELLQTIVDLSQE